MATKSHHPDGTSVIEVLLALSMAAIIFVSVGKVLTTVLSTNTLSRQKEEATALAKEPLEIMTDIQQAAFGCQCDSHDCVTAPGVCIRNDALGPQSCTLKPLYTSCWTQQAKNVSQLTPLRIEEEAGSWVVKEGAEEISGHATYTRTVTIENLSRNAAGEIVESGGVEDTNTKRVTSTVSWNVKGKNRIIAFTTLLTAWQNQ